MKLKSIYIFLLFIFISLSCKNESKSTTEEEAKNSKPFVVSIKAKVKEDDVICLYYKDNTITFFSEAMVVYKNLKKGDNLQDIVFELPKNALPNDFRFDLSCQNKNQVMYVEKINFSYEDKNFDILNKDLEKYLKPNDGVVFDSKSRTFSFKEIDQNYDPFLTTTGEFYPLLEELVGYEAFKPRLK